MDDADVRVLVERTEAALAGLDGLAPDDAGAATDAVAALVGLYGEALVRIVAIVGLEVLAGDELIRHLLMLHGIVPLEVPEGSAGSGGDASFIPLDSIGVRRGSPA